MKKIPCFILLRLALLSAVSMGAVSCIKSDSAGCIDPRGNVRLSIRLDAAIRPVSRAGVGDFQIDRANVYVFDAGDRFVTSVEGGEYTGEDYLFFLDLPTGTYHFIVWTNPGEQYKTTPGPDDPQARSMDEWNIHLDPGGGSLTGQIPDLLYGTARDQSIAGGRDNRVEVSMIPNTYTVNVNVKGLEPTADAFEFTITDNNSHYTFDNTLIEGQDDFQHTRTALYNGGELYASIKTLKLSEERHPQFVFRNASTGEVLFDQSLTRTILNAYTASGQTVDFDRIFTYDIVLTFDTSLGVTVSVNGWVYEQKNTDLQ